MLARRDGASAGGFYLCKVFKAYFISSMSFWLSKLRITSTSGSQTQQVNTPTGFPERRADLPLESDKFTKPTDLVGN